jgi:hypothetical protein
VKGLDADSLLVTHIQVNRAIQQRRRTYRAHGRINRKSPAPHAPPPLISKSPNCKPPLFLRPQLFLPSPTKEELCQRVSEERALFSSPPPRTLRSRRILLYSSLPNERNKRQSADIFSTLLALPPPLSIIPTAYMSSPCHVEVVLSEKVESVKKEEEARGPKVTAKNAARLRIRSGSSSAK